MFEVIRTYETLDKVSTFEKALEVCEEFVKSHNVSYNKLTTRKFETNSKITGYNYIMHVVIYEYRTLYLETFIIREKLEVK